MVLNNAPDYREPFLRELSQEVDLTLVARPCEPEGLTPPTERIGYRYIEIPAKRFLGVLWQPGLSEVVDEGGWEALGVSINMRDIGRILLFLRRKELRSRWVWWGHVFGRTPLKLLDAPRRFLLKRGAGALVFTEGVAQAVRERYGVEATPFNNTQVKEDQFRPGSFEEHQGLRLLFVGRLQPRKRLERLVALAEREPRVQLRLIGPGMDALEVPQPLLESGQLRRYGRLAGDELDEHFDWADLVANPGHVGLLVMHAAQHGKGIVIDSESAHAPEYWLAREAEQPFIDFSDEAAVDRFVGELLESEDGRTRLRNWGSRLQEVARERYTIEHMAAVHARLFRAVAGRGL